MESRVQLIKQHGKRTFTLIELLVVIAIIAILMGIILPAMKSARERGREINCLSNIRQIGTTLVGYADENDNVVIPAFTSVDGVDCTWLDYFYYTRKLTDKNTFTCPSIPKGNHFDPKGGDSLSRHLTAASYIMNTIETGAWAPMTASHIEKPNESTGWGQDELIPIRTQQVKIPSQNIYVTDVNYQNITDDEQAIAILEYGETDQGTIDKQKVGRHHRKGFNAVYGDGHGEIIKDKQSELKNWIVVGKALM